MRHSSAVWLNPYNAPVEDDYEISTQARPGGGLPRGAGMEEYFSMPGSRGGLKRRTVLGDDSGLSGMTLGIMIVVGAFIAFKVLK